MAQPYNSDADRINMLRVYLNSALAILRGSGNFNRETLAKSIDQQLATDTDRAALLPAEKPMSDQIRNAAARHVVSNTIVPGGNASSATTER